MTGGTGAPELTIGCSEHLADTKMAAIDDPVNWVVCGDVCMSTSVALVTQSLFETCGWCAPADWEYCPWTENCGLNESQSAEFWGSTDYQRSFTRHLGGSNFGFADGHVAWWNAYSMLDRCATIMTFDADWNCSGHLTGMDRDIYGFNDSCWFPSWE